MSAIPSIAVDGTEPGGVAFDPDLPAVKLDATPETMNSRPSRQHSHGPVVVSDVIGRRHDFKVLNAVVRAVAVDVVDVFCGSKRASKMLFHDVTMLQHVAAVSGELNVSVGPDGSRDKGIAALARAETHAPTSESGRGHVESASARFAVDRDSHSSLASP